MPLVYVNTMHDKQSAISAALCVSVSRGEKVWEVFGATERKAAFPAGQEGN